MNESNDIARDDELLHAYHDGELSGFARRRFEQRLRRSPELRAELDSLSSLGAALRELDANGPSPDLWDDIALRLPGLDARRDAEVEPARSGWLVWLFGPAGAALATAAAAVALALAVYTPEIQPAGATIRWLDTGGRSVMVFDDDADMTIIWMLDAGEGGGVS
jgi:anti-sigma factor RsiW